MPFWGGVRTTFPSNDVTHPPNPQKDRPWAEPRHLSHKAQISVARLELGVLSPVHTSNNAEAILSNATR